MLPCPLFWHYHVYSVFCWMKLQTILSNSLSLMGDDDADSQLEDERMRDNLMEAAERAERDAAASQLRARVGSAGTAGDMSFTTEGCDDASIGSVASSIAAEKYAELHRSVEEKNAKRLADYQQSVQAETRRQALDAENLDGMQVRPGQDRAWHVY